MCPFQLYHLRSSATESKLGYVTLSYLTYAGAIVWPIGSGKLLAVQGLLYKERKKSKHEVALYLTKCRAQVERINIQKHDELFASKNPCHFKSCSSKSEGTSLLIDGTLVSDPDIVLKKWAEHFSILSEFQYSLDSSCHAQSLFQMEAKTYQESDFVLDLPSVVEEIETAFHHHSSGSHDQLSPSHLSYSGPLFKNWICKILMPLSLLRKFLLPLGTALYYPHTRTKGKSPPTEELQRYHPYLQSY